jgi:hypothetical protein
MDYVTGTLENVKNGVASMFDSKKETENVNDVDTNQKTEYQPRDFLSNFYKKEGGKRNKKSKQKTNRNRNKKSKQKTNRNRNKKSKQKTKRNRKNNKKSKKQQSK